MQAAEFCLNRVT